MAERDNKVLWPVAGAFVVAVVGVCLAVFSSDPATSLRLGVPDPDSFGLVIDVRPETPYHVITTKLCVAHGAVTIKAVVPQQPSGRIRVVDWALGDHHYNGIHDAIPGRAAAIRGFHQGQVTGSCDHPQWFAISVELAGGTATANGFEVQSSSGSVVLPFALALCDGTQTCPKEMSYSGTP